jgi:hypothetical protein
MQKQYKTTLSNGITAVKTMGNKRGQQMAAGGRRKGAVRLYQNAVAKQRRKLPNLVMCLKLRA